jgi:hypothetical protein
MINTLASKNYIEKLFEIWISGIDNFTFDIQNKKSLIGFCSILLQDPTTMNSVILSNIKIIISQIIKLAKKLFDKYNKPKDTKTSSLTPDLDTYLQNVNLYNIRQVVTIKQRTTMMTSSRNSKMTILTLRTKNGTNMNI